MPEYHNQHERQVLGLEGPDLEAARRRQILASARNISRDSIRQISDAEFSVASETHPDHLYRIDLTKSTCDCSDFPRIRHCKHIAAINVHFPQLYPKVDNHPEMQEHVHVPDLPKSTLRSQQETPEILLEDIDALYQQLCALSDRSALDLKALRSVKYSLSAAISSANGSRALPERAVFNPRANLWDETTGVMGGSSKSPKRKRAPTGGNTSTERIGAVKGKRVSKFGDEAYAAGERSGKRAKPDAVSAAANELSRASVPAPPPFTNSSMPSPARAPPSAAAAGSAGGYFTRADRPSANPLGHPLPGVVPGLALSHYPAALPGYAFASPSATVAGSAGGHFTRADRSSANPVRHPPPGAVPGLAFSHLPVAPPGFAFAPPSAAIPRFAHAGPSTQMHFWTEIMPGSGFAHARSPPGGPPT